MLWACVLLPQLALDGVLRRHPTPDAPLALISGPQQQRRLHAVNRTAAAHGLHAGQSLATAQALLGRFAQLEYDRDEETRHQSLLAAWAYRYSSQVSTGFADAVLLEVGASLGLFGPWPRLESQLRSDLDALGFQHRIAMAPNARAAWLLAAADDGLALTTSETTITRLARLPVSQARLEPRVANALHSMGLRHLGQLFSAPRASLARRFGASLMDHLDRLRGQTADPLSLYRPPDRFDARIELSYEIENWQPLLFPLRRLIADLGAYLAGRDGGVQHFVIHFEHEADARQKHPDTLLEIGMLAAERDPQLLFELARSRLQQHGVARPVRALRLRADQLPPFVPAGRELFDTRPANSVPWPALRERLRARLGDDAVYALNSADDHRPEQACVRQPLPSARSAAMPPGARPTWLLSRPIPLRDPSPRVLAGPERLETGWWDGGDLRRDYYIVETCFGQRAWAFCAVGERGPFMLHGWFA